MDKQNNDAVNKPAEAVSTAATGIAAMAKTTIDQAKEKIQKLHDPAVEALQQARSAVADAGNAAQDLVHRARDQATVAVDTMQQQSRRMGEYLTRNAKENPLGALLIAGAVGYGLAYLIHRH